MGPGNKQLQIRLTEPVVFLRGPSTGLDFRGRPQVISADAQPAQLRGLLTLRLSKPTRIRKIEIKLEGKSRTEWPEGIGPRHMETHEEKQILLEKTTYFSALDSSNSRSRSNRRAASVGPGGVDVSQFDIPSSEIDDDAIDLDERVDQVLHAGEEGERTQWDAPDPWTMVRSASALPGTHDRHSWHRDGFSRRPSFDHEADDEDEDGSGLASNMGRLDVGPSEPSPAYTPLPETHPTSSRRSSFGHPGSNRRSPRGRNSPLPPSREPALSPIISAAPSRAASNRDESSSTERRNPTQNHPTLKTSDLANIPNDDEESGPEDTGRLGEEDISPTNTTAMPLPAQSILANHHQDRSHTPRGSVCFADRVREGSAAALPGESEHVTAGPSSDVPVVVSNRTASVRTLNSDFSASTSSLGHSHEQPSPSDDTRPRPEGIRTISVNSTAHNSPAASTAASIRTRPSSDTLARETSATESGVERVASNNTPLVSSPLHEMASFTGDVPLPNGHNAQTSVSAGSQTVPGTVPVTDTNAQPSTAPAYPQRPHLTEANRHASDHSNRSVSFDVTPNGQPAPHQDVRSGERSPEDAYRGRRSSSRFSIAAAIGAVKERVSSKSRSRAGSRIPSRSQSVTPMDGASINEHPQGSAKTSTSSTQHLDHQQHQQNRHAYDGTTSHGHEEPWALHRRSKDRASSPARRSGEESPFRGRGRHKGMKVLTDALGLGDHPHHHHEGEDIHNWKEFRKGTYNYPISFAIPVEAPPSLHAEFGSVTYRLKATVIRVGALTPNLTEDLEVTMIASPQDDDLEETENVIVERQWEEQMRYQIALGGKAFPIGGIIPVSIRLMPLMKCKIHRLSAILEEKIDYFAHGKRITRHETPKKFVLMFIKQLEKYAGAYPLLPIMSEEPDAAKESPLAPLAAQAAHSNPNPNEVEPDGEDWQYAQLMDPLGPWHFEKNLQIPDCASLLKVTSKHEKTSIHVTHFLKITIRVERGDDEAVDSKGRRKQFDIIIDTPIKILDCRVNPSWNSLPTYAAHNPSAMPMTAGYCSIHNPARRAPVTGSKPANWNPNPQTRGEPVDPLVSSASSSTPARYTGISNNYPPNDRGEMPRPAAGAGAGLPRRNGPDTLLERNIVYDRLMSGQETETGEVPPSYGEAVANAIRSASRSASRQGLGRQAAVSREGSRRPSFGAGATGVGA